MFCIFFQSLLVFPGGTASGQFSSTISIIKLGMPLWGAFLFPSTLQMAQGEDDFPPPVLLNVYSTVPEQIKGRSVKKNKQTHLQSSPFLVLHFQFITKPCQFDCISIFSISLSYDWVERLNIIKMIILSKLIYKFNGIPIKTQYDFFFRPDKFILKFIWRKTFWGIVKKYIKIFYKATIIKAICYWLYFIDRK